MPNLQGLWGHWWILLVIELNFVIVEFWWRTSMDTVLSGSDFQGAVPTITKRRDSDESIGGSEARHWLQRESAR